MRKPVLRSTLSGTLLLLALCLNAPTLTSQSPSVSPANLSATVGPYGNCMPPDHAGVNVCSPLFSPTTAFYSDIGSPFQVVGVGTGGGGPVQRMELWADGKKIAQVNSYIFDQRITLPEGVHKLTLVEVDSTGSYAKSPTFAIEVRANTASQFCAPPSGPGVHVCEPFSTEGCHLAGYSILIATGSPASGYVKRMELWVGNTKMANFPGNKINTSLYINDYSQIRFVVVDSNGGYVKSPVYTITAC